MSISIYTIVVNIKTLIIKSGMITKNQNLKTLLLGSVITIVVNTTAIFTLVDVNHPTTINVILFGIIIVNATPIILNLVYQQRKLRKE